MCSFTVCRCQIHAAPVGYDATHGNLDMYAMTHGMIVQLNFLDLDNNYLLNVLRTHPDRLRDIAVVDQAARLAGRSASDRARIDAGAEVIAGGGSQRDGRSFRPVAAAVGERLAAYAV